MAEIAFKKKSKKTSARKRDVEDEEADEADDRVLTSTDLKKRRTGPTQQVQPVLGKDMSSIGVAFAASGTAASLFDGKSSATRTLDVDNDPDPEGKFGKLESVLDMDSGADANYKGLKGYTQFINKKSSKTTQSNAGQGLVAAGPLKGMSNVKISSRFDYAPAICKDYKETGFCGFGDSCVFMHDRGDYKQGWQLDLEWEEEQRRLEGENNPDSKYFKGHSDVEEEQDSDDDLPFACLICRGEFKDPVVTKCKHYFCERCALKNFTKTPGCFACNLNTLGVFNTANEFKKKLGLKKERMAAREKQIRESANKEKVDRNGEDEDQIDYK